MGDFEPWLKEAQSFVDEALAAHLPFVESEPRTLHESMHYSVFAGGKRLRPILCIAVAEAFGGSRQDASTLASAIELLHTYTLVHDDLPCMDDDDLRRGVATNHVVFGEGIAVLTGDALLTESFNLVARTPGNLQYGVADYVSVLATAAGSRQLIGGQTLDIEAEGREINIEHLKKIHERKTAALLVASLKLGAMSAGATKQQLQTVAEFGYNVGLAYQVVDDILDITQTTEKLGKTAGKDVQVNKATYPAIVGLKQSKIEAKLLTEKAFSTLDSLGVKAFRLSEIAQYLLVRDY